MTKTRVLAVVLALVMVFALSSVASAAGTKDVADLVNFGGKTWYVLSDTATEIKLMAQENVVGDSMGAPFGGSGDYLGSDVQKFLDGPAFEATFAASVYSVLETQSYNVYKFGSLANFNSNNPLATGIESVSSKFRLLNKAEFDALTPAQRSTIFKDSKGINHWFFMNGMGMSGQVYYSFPSAGVFNHMWADLSAPYEVLPVIVLDWTKIDIIGDVIYPKGEVANADLLLLEVSDGSLIPAFDPAKTEYNVHVWDIDKIEIFAQAAVGTIKTGSDVGVQDLVLGENEFKITVVAPNGTTEKVYTVTVILTAEPLLTIGGNTHFIWPIPAATETVQIPIAFHHSLADLDGIINLLSAGYWFTITYDTDMLEFNGPYTDSNSERIIVINHHPDDPEGTLRVVYNATFDSSLNPVLNMLKIDELLVPFKVIGSPVRHDETILELSKAIVLDGNIEKYDYITTVDVTVVFTGSVRKLGDVNNDDEVTPEDAMLLLQWLVGLPTPGVVWDAETLWAANVKGYGDPDVTDAALILRMVVGG